MKKRHMQEKIDVFFILKEIYLKISVQLKLQYSSLDVYFFILFHWTLHCEKKLEIFPQLLPLYSYLSHTCTHKHAHTHTHTHTHTHQVWHLHSHILVCASWLELTSAGSVAFTDVFSWSRNKKKKNSHPTPDIFCTSASPALHHLKTNSCNQ